MFKQLVNKQSHNLEVELRIASRMKYTTLVLYLLFCLSFVDTYDDITYTYLKKRLGTYNVVIGTYTIIAFNIERTFSLINVVTYSTW